MAFGEYFKKIDIFGVPVSLSYKGEQEFTTRCGGIVTLLIIIFCSSLIMSGVLDLLS